MNTYLPDFTTNQTADSFGEAFRSAFGDVMRGSRRAHDALIGMLATLGRDLLNGTDPREATDQLTLCIQHMRNQNPGTKMERDVIGWLKETAKLRVKDDGTELFVATRSKGQAYDVAWLDACKARPFYMYVKSTSAQKDVSIPTSAIETAIARLVALDKEAYNNHNLHEFQGLDYFETDRYAKFIDELRQQVTGAVNSGIANSNSAKTVAWLITRNEAKAN